MAPNWCKKNSEGWAMLELNMERISSKIVGRQYMEIFYCIPSLIMKDLMVPETSDCLAKTSSTIYITTRLGLSIDDSKSCSLEICLQLNHDNKIHETVPRSRSYKEFENWQPATDMGNVVRSAARRIWSVVLDVLPQWEYPDTHASKCAVRLLLRHIAEGV